MPEKFISLATLAAIVGLGTDADEAAVTAKIKDALAVSELKPLSALLKDGKILIVDTVSAIDTRLKKLEEAGTNQIATLSATIDGKVHTYTAKDIVTLAARLDAIEQAGKASLTAALEAEKNKIVPLFASEGKAPINPATQKAYTADELRALDVPTLKVLHANTPVTVPLNARGKVAGENKGGDLKGAARAGAAWGHLDK